MMKLVELYQIGKANKKRKISANRAKEILNTTLISDRWYDQLIVTVPKIKAFFSMAPAKMQIALQKAELDQDDVDNAAAELVNETNEEEQNYMNDQEQEYGVDQPGYGFENLSLD